MNRMIRLTGLVSALIMAFSIQACDASEEPLLPSKGVRERSSSDSTGLWHTKAWQTYQAVERLYSNKYGLYDENYPRLPDDGDASFLWPFDGYMSAVANLNRLGYDVNYVAMVEKYEMYRTTPGKDAYSSGAGGYGERYYDDNSIVGINLVEAYNQLHEDPANADRCAEYLKRCGVIVKFLKTGLDDIFGGGLWWCEQFKNIPEKSEKGSNKPACANGFAQWFLLSYYDICPESEKEEVLNLAKQLYSWEYNTLRDSDNVYLNDKGADGRLHSTKWAYNSGAMIASGYRLYNITGEKHYLDEAIATADASYNHFVRSRDPIPLSYPLNDPWFTIKLIRAYMELEPAHPKCTVYIEVFISNLKRAWTYGRQSNGLWYEDWTGASNPERDGSLLMQAAAIDALGTVALYKKEHKESE